MYTVICPFFVAHVGTEDRMHHAECWDELDESILRCRDRATANERGALEDWRDRETRPVPVEARVWEAISRGRLLPDEE